MMTPAEMVAKKKAEKRAAKIKGRKSDLGSYGNRKVKFDCKLQTMLGEMGLTAYDLASACGFDNSAVYPIMDGAGISLTTAFRIARFFGKPVEEIWSLKEEKKGK